MKKLLILLLTFPLTSWALDYDLSGVWISSSSSPDHPVEFIPVDGVFHYYSQETYVFPNREVSHTIDQSLKVISDNSPIIEGSVDFYDSRGCSFKDLPVKGEFAGKDVVNFLVTVPRYKTVRITTGPTSGYYRPIYCTAPGRYGRRPYQYICDHEYVRPNVRTECRLLEYVEVPVQLKRSL